MSPGRSVVAGLVASVALAGCAGLPDRGPVEVEEPAEPSSSAAPFDFKPPGPVADASQEQVVAGFLRALQATPANTGAAAEFLTDEAAAGWHPDRGTVVYDGLRTRARPATVTVLLDGAFELDGTGRYVGTMSGDAREVVFRLAREDGEWRISNAPDAMVVPRSHFATRYREYQLYFFDPTGSVLVPEPVHLPWGPQLPTHLVAGLISGPPAGSRGVERSYFPRSTRLGLSVPVRDDGVAEVPLSDEVRDLEADDLERMLAQLAWTLRQVTEVDRLTVTVDGTPVELPARGRRVQAAGWEEYDPAAPATATQLFGVRGGDVVQVTGSELSAVASVSGAGAGTPRELAVSPTGGRFAVVSEDGRRVVTFRGAATGEEQPRQVYAGVDVLQPMWDRTDRLWLVDRTSAGATVTVVGEGGLTRLTAPRITGTDVVAAALSGDGTRLAVVQRIAGAYRLAVARVQRDGSGAPVGVTTARPAPTAELLPGARAVGWRNPSTVAVLTRPSSTTTGIVLASVDGSSAAVGQEPSVDLLFDAGSGLAADPAAPGRLVVETVAGQVHQLDPQGRWDLAAAPEGLRAVTFAG